MNDTVKKLYQAQVSDDAGITVSIWAEAHPHHIKGCETVVKVSMASVLTKSPIVAVFDQTSVRKLIGALADADEALRDHLSDLYDQVEH